MDLSTPSVIWLIVFIFLVAMLYSSVGHGGASGYLAILSLVGGVSQNEMSTTALILNLFVSLIAFISFYKAGHFSLALSWPFIVLSIPMAFLGGMIQLDNHTYYLLLSFVLILAAIKLAINIPLKKSNGNNNTIEKQKLYYSLPIGAGIGLLSGIVGVGGGIFLSPLIIFLRWGDLKQTSCTSAFFIFVNSIAGLLGRHYQHRLEVGDLWILLISAFLGGLVGSYIGAKKFSDLTLSRTLAIVLFIAAIKLILKY